MSYKNVVAEKTTVTRDTIRIEEKTGNIYESIVAVSKRSNQISVEIKEELTSKLQEFASSTDNLEEIFENREQIEISNTTKVCQKQQPLRPKSYLMIKYI